MTWQQPLSLLHYVLFTLQPAAVWFPFLHLPLNCSIHGQIWSLFPNPVDTFQLETNILETHLCSIMWPWLPSLANKDLKTQILVYLSSLNSLSSLSLIPTPSYCSVHSFPGDSLNLCEGPFPPLPVTDVTYPPMSLLLGSKRSLTSHGEMNCPFLVLSVLPHHIAL